jgi:hypothetical protein
MNNGNAFTRWLDTFVSEKGLDTEQTFDKEGPSGLNVIPLGCVIEAIKSAPAHEQAAIKATIVKIDYRNGDVLHFFGHLAGALAL